MDDNTAQVVSLAVFTFWCAIMYFLERSYDYRTDALEARSKEQAEFKKRTEERWAHLPPFPFPLCSLFWPFLGRLIDEVVVLGFASSRETKTGSIGESGN